MCIIFCLRQIDNIFCFLKFVFNKVLHLQVHVLMPSQNLVKGTKIDAFNGKDWKIATVIELFEKSVKVRWIGSSPEYDEHVLKQSDRISLLHSHTVHMTFFPIAFNRVSFRCFRWLNKSLIHKNKMYIASDKVLQYDLQTEKLTHFFDHSGPLAIDRENGLLYILAPNNLYQLNLRTKVCRHFKTPNASMKEGIILHHPQWERCGCYQHGYQQEFVLHTFDVFNRPFYFDADRSMFIRMHVPIKRDPMFRNTKCLCAAQLDFRHSIKIWNKFDRKAGKFVSAEFSDILGENFCISNVFVIYGTIIVVVGEDHRFSFLDTISDQWYHRKIDALGTDSSALCFNGNDNYCLLYTSDAADD